MIRNVSDYFKELFGFFYILHSFNLNQERFLNFSLFQITMATEIVCIPTERYEILKKKEVVADDILFQLEVSLKNIEQGRIKRVR